MTERSMALVSRHPRSSRALRALALVLLAALLPRPAGAQCTPQWLPGEGVPGLNGTVNALANWDPDGLGPLSPTLVAGGSFTIAGQSWAANIAMWSPATGRWSSLDTGINGAVYSLAVLTGGDLVAGGLFTNAGGTAAGSIARWDGAAWSALGAGIGSSFPFVFALAVLPSGDLIAAGRFTIAGGARPPRSSILARA
jgi:cortical protein marker for cell polarity